MVRGLLKSVLSHSLSVAGKWQNQQLRRLNVHEYQIAVKRLKIWSAKADMEFAVEVEILGRVRHKNLLSLRGYCAEGQERLIVYDYMPNLSLLSHLHGLHSAECLLDWIG